MPAGVTVDQQAALTVLGFIGPNAPRAAEWEEIKEEFVQVCGDATPLN